jgi:long-chain acyl-CoA synthetase
MITAKDEYTVTLGVVALTVALVHRFLVPPSLVHPLLLGRQSHVGQVRKRNESAMYSNYGIGSSPVCLQVFTLSIARANSRGSYQYPQGAA